MGKIGAIIEDQNYILHIHIFSFFFSLSLFFYFFFKFSSLIHETPSGSHYMSRQASSFGRKKGQTQWNFSQQVLRCEALPTDYFRNVKMEKKSSLGLLRDHFLHHQKPSCLWTTERDTNNRPLKEMPGWLTGTARDRTEFLTQFKKSMPPRVPFA